MIISAASRLGMFLRLGAQIGQIDVAVAVAADDHHLQSGHRRAGGVGAVRRGRDQAHVAMLLRRATHARPGSPADRHIRPAIRHSAAAILPRNPVTAHSQASSRRISGQIPLGLVRRRERMDVGEAGQRDRDHLGRRVQLHRAGPERDHAAIERDVLVFQALQIAQHLVFGVMLVEDRLLQERRPTQQTPAGMRRTAPAELGTQQAGQRLQVIARDGFVQRDADAGVVDAPEIEASLRRARDQRRRVAASTTIVSKNDSWRTAARPAMRASASIRACSDTRRAMRRSPSGPCQTA